MSAATRSDCRVFGLMTAAGALNYADRRVALRELARLVVYDFGTGRPRGCEPLWGADPDYAMDPRELAFEAAGLRLASFVERQITIRMTLDGYVRYMRTEGGPGGRLWAREMLIKGFDECSLDVIFDTYGACALHDS